MGFTRLRAIIVGGLALFSMFFGAGNVIFPMVLGAATGTHPAMAVVGLVATAVIFPLIGLLGIMLFDGDQHSFFGRVGKWGGWILYFICQLVLGVVGSTPRNITLMYGTLSPYLPGISIALFAAITAVVMFLVLLKRGRLVEIVGSILTPLLLISVAAVVIIGLFGGHPAPAATSLSGGGSFAMGFREGYNMLDLIAAPLFGPLVMTFFRRSESNSDPKVARRSMIRSFFWASLIATGLLVAVYGGLTLLASYYVPHLPAGIPPEQLLQAVSMVVLGPVGAFFASMVVVLACFTTAISLVAIFADYVRKDWFKGRIGPLWPTVGTLVVAGGIATLGLSGIMTMLAPLLIVAYPVYIVLSVLNIGNKLYAFQPVKIPVAVTLTASALFLLI